MKGQLKNEGYKIAYPLETIDGCTAYIRVDKELRGVHITDARKLSKVLLEHQVICTYYEQYDKSERRIRRIVEPA